MTGASERAWRGWAGLSALLAAAALGGCAPEVYKGPRVVPYTDSSFYVRHLPLMSGADSVEAMAEEICSSAGMAQAVLRDAYQDVPLSMRYATYDCI